MCVLCLPFPSRFNVPPLLFKAWGEQYKIEKGCQNKSWWKRKHKIEYCEYSYCHCQHPWFSAFQYTRKTFKLILPMTMTEYKPKHSHRDKSNCNIWTSLFEVSGLARPGCAPSKRPAKARPEVAARQRLCFYGPCSNQWGEGIPWLPGRGGPGPGTGRPGRGRPAREGGEAAVSQPAPSTQAGDWPSLSPPYSLPPDPSSPWPSNQWPARPRQTPVSRAGELHLLVHELGTKLRTCFSTENNANIPGPGLYSSFNL